MLKLSKMTFAIVVSNILIGCANIDDSYHATLQDFQQYEALTQQYNIQENWWTQYNDEPLNQLVKQALKNNKDLAKATIAVNTALYNANLVAADLVPNFTRQTGVNSSAAKNINTGSNSKITHGGSLNISYTLDLWQRLADKTSAAKWTHSATQQDLQATKLSLINSVVTTYYQLAYLNDAIAVTNQTINYYSKISRIMQNKFKQGMADRASTDQSQQSILKARNNLINYQTQKKRAETTLRNLLNLKPNEDLNIKTPNILEVKSAEVNLDIPLSTIANRPDIKGSLYRLNSAFKNAKAMQKSWFPSITLGAGLSSSGNKIDNAFNIPIATGTVGINLPFLNWNTVKWNVKISEAAYENAKLNFEQNITKALNEIDNLYFSYTQAKENVANLQETYRYNKRITQYYKNRYDAGIAELIEWLNAANIENTSQLAILNAKYSLIQSQNAIYSAMGGYYSTNSSR
ncbi:toxin/drug exporter TdeA [Histophilus somni]|uniref:toxin/drug exporter TdeA n=1 Tax=Histophilus somni TaxID=731 RepID=UPI003877CCA5